MEATPRRTRGKSAVRFAFNHSMRIAVSRQPFELLDTVARPDFKGLAKPRLVRGEVDERVTCIYTQRRGRETRHLGLPGLLLPLGPQTARPLTRLYEESLRQHGLRATQFSILAALTLKGPTVLGDLAGVLGLDRTTLTRSAGLLERKRRVARGQSSDAREHVLKVTQAGREKLEAAFPARQEAQDQAGLMLPTGEWTIAGAG
jgi:DNA-binding MarR family transcriptional regulator